VASVLGSIPPLGGEYPIPREEWPLLVDAAALNGVADKALEQGPIWPVFVAGAAFLYLWWLAIISFDLTFIWHLYIRHSGAQKLIRERLEQAHALPYQLEPTAPPRSLSPDAAVENADVGSSSRG
jgi:hypothetical protein